MMPATTVTNLTLRLRPATPSFILPLAGEETECALKLGALGLLYLSPCKGER
jgi:hypothetical protein